MSADMVALLVTVLLVVLLTAAVWKVGRAVRLRPTRPAELTPREPAPAGARWRRRRRAVGGALLACILVVGLVAETVLRVFEPAAVSLHLQLQSAVAELRWPAGSGSPSCRASGQGQVCASSDRVRPNAEVPVDVVPTRPLPPGVGLLYWGCEQGSAARSCTVDTRHERTVCVTTTSAADARFRAVCTRVSGQVSGRVSGPGGTEPARR